MQEPTHILAGIIIQKSFEWKKPRAVALGLTATVAFLSHGFLDKLANLTYHPSAPDFHSPFWVSYHGTLAVTTVAFLYCWWKRFKWGIFFSILPDLDWIFIHGQQIFHIQIPFYQHPYLHMFLHWIYAKVPPLSWLTPYLDALPSYRHNPWACLGEGLLVAVMLLIIQMMTMAQRPSAQPINSQKT